MAWIPNEFCRNTVAMILTLVLFDFWPVAGISNSSIKVLAASAIVIMLGAVVYYVGVHVAGMGPGPLSVTGCRFLYLRHIPAVEPDAGGPCLPN